MCIRMEHLVFIDISYLPMPLRKVPEAFGLTARKSWYPHLFNTSANLDLWDLWQTSVSTAPMG